MSSPEPLPSTTQNLVFPRLVILPAGITLAVTVLRLVGELSSWSPIFFSRSMGLSVVGIIWLAPLAGVYFAWRLSKAGAWPRSFLSAIGYSLLGVALLVVCASLPGLIGIKHGFYDRLIYGWAIFVAAALVTRRGWPQLFQALALYGLAARLPVAVIMFFALWGDWGTHFDAVPPDLPALALLAKYLWIGLIPQLTLWVACTVLAGMLFGTIISGIARLVKIDRGVPV